MKTLLEKLLKFLGLLVLIIVVSLIPELIGGDIAAALKEKLGDHYYLTIGGIGFFTILAYTLWTEGDKIFKKKKGEPTAEAVSEDNLQKIRAGLLESYQERLKSKLAARFPINLELKYSTEGTKTRADIYDNKTIRSTKIKEELIHLFDKHRGRLLIIGEPGAGKTTLLLQLAYQLLYRQDPVITDIPIIINMATWRERFSSVEEWLKELLPQMGFSKALVEQLLTENRLLPLFDGLDELSEDLRKPCLEAIADFGKARLAQYVICSRIVEYSETVDAPVYCQIMVKPLTITQIKEGLQEVNSPETNGILDAMKKDSLLREAIKTPFYLNTVQLLFASSKVWEEFDFKGDTLEGRQQEIVEFFVADATGGFEKYSSEQVKKYLGFLADRMTWKGLVEFELVDLQYDWITLKKKDLIKANIVDCVVSDFYFGMIVIIVMFFISLYYDHSNSILIGLMTGLSLLLVVLISENLKKNPYPITIVESRLAFLLEPIVEFFKILFTIQFLIGMPISILLGLITSIAGVDSTDFQELRIKLENIIGHNSFLLNVVLFFIILLGPNIFLSFLLLRSGYVAKSQFYLTITKPLQRFWSSMWVLHFSIFRYMHLKNILTRMDLMPKKLVSLLREAAKQRILEEKGGSWRFRHYILQKYFAGYWVQNYAKEYPKGKLSERTPLEFEDILPM